MALDTDYVFGETNTDTVFVCTNCVPVIELNLLQVHILFNALGSVFFDRQLTDAEQAEYDRIMGILMVSMEDILT